MARIKKSEIILYWGPDREQIEAKMIEQFLLLATGARGTNARGESYLLCSGPAVWIERIMFFLIRNRLAAPREIHKGTAQDLRSEARLRIIFDSNIRRFYQNPGAPPRRC